jgi:LAO/AO transport system kinase
LSRSLPSKKTFVDGILAGNRMLLSRAITLVESNRQEHQNLAQEIIEGCLPHSGNSIRLGITGVPGVGKSTFIEAFGNYVLEQQNRTLAVLAVDPSSSRTRGSILGDKTRMETLANHPKAYIRPTPTSGSLGGVAKNTRETITLCEAAGFNTILIETVGVGQSETAVHSMVDFFLLLMLAGAGDELQGIKRGIMEMADSIIINKADFGIEQAAKRAMNEYKNALHLFPPANSGWTPKVATCSAVQGKGIAEVWEIIDEFMRHTKANGFF